ncbi:MAG: usg protein [Pseudomonadota bacterium]
MRPVDKAFRRQLNGYSLATAEITYHMPDARSLLQTFVWQDYDLAPAFPELKKFLDFWARELDGPLHSVRVAHSALIKPAEFSVRDFEITIH